MTPAEAATGGWMEPDHSVRLRCCGWSVNEVTDLEKQSPLKGPGYQGYFASGWMAATCTSVALFHREVMGEGQFVDIS